MQQTNIESDDPQGYYASGLNLPSTASEGIVGGIGGYCGEELNFL
jgi:hypothetical protein